MGECEFKKECPSNPLRCQKCCKTYKTVEVITKKEVSKNGGSEKKN